MSAYARRRGAHPMVRFFRAASLVAGLVAIALLAAITTLHFAIHGAEVQVPALKGMTVADARSQTSGLGLNLEVDNRYYSSDVAAGHILTQSPEPGTVVRREWRVRVSESLGPQKVEVPNTVGADERVAALNLRRVGLAVGATAHLPYSGAIEGVVLAQDPPARAQGIEGPSVNLLVALPPEETPDGFVMPDVAGMPVVSAQTALTRVGLKFAPPSFVDVHVPPVGEGSAPLKPPVLPGSVIAQQPPAGSRVDQSMQVRLTVAK
ncbi:MAG TPA: PASTA domain-containing protein [Terracidiphilus sp.]|jgi:beta-lactam-binding protein with PASTA domain|nr:PASTA domain-containing protein [Terracidiphilus sp.]